MIVRTARLHGLSNETQADGSDSFVVRASFDESASTSFRLSREEHAALKAALLDGARFEVCLRVLPKPPVAP